MSAVTAGRTRDTVWLLDVDLDPAPAGTAGESDSAAEPTTDSTRIDPGTDTSSTASSAGLPPGFGNASCGCDSNRPTSPPGSAPSPSLLRRRRTWPALPRRPGAR